MKEKADPDGESWCEEDVSEIKENEEIGSAGDGSL
jgi:hypothetical protein